jgi:hypothetical protein
MNAKAANSGEAAAFPSTLICRLAATKYRTRTLENPFQLLVTASFVGSRGEDICLMPLLSVLRGSLSWTRCRDLEGRSRCRRRIVLNPWWRME